MLINPTGLDFLINWELPPRRSETGSFLSWMYMTFGGVGKDWVILVLRNKTLLQIQETKDEERQERRQEKQINVNHFCCSSEEPRRGWKPFLHTGSDQGWNTIEIFQTPYSFKALKGTYSRLQMRTEVVWSCAPQCTSVWHQQHCPAFPDCSLEDTSPAKQLDWRGEQ